MHICSCVWVHMFVCMYVGRGQRLMLGISFECSLFYLWMNNLSLNPSLASQLTLVSSVSAFWVLNLHRWVTKSPGFYVGAGGQSFNFHAFLPSTFLLEPYSHSTWFCFEFGSSLKVQLFISMIFPLFCLSLLYIFFYFLPYANFGTSWCFFFFPSGIRQIFSLL